MRTESESTRKATIQLNPAKVGLRLAQAGGPIKTYAVGVSEKTIHRIKSGERTTLSTAHLLAKSLRTNIEDLLLPPDLAEVERQLPRNWLYEGVALSAEPRRHFPAQVAIGCDDDGYLVDRWPSGWQDPLDTLLKCFPQYGRKFVLRRETHAYVVELHYFEYTPDIAQEIDYHAASALRFFALARSGDEFKKAVLNEFDAEVVWSNLQHQAMQRADIVDLAGCIASGHPRDYIPVVRFYRGMIVRRRIEGVRVFGQLHQDFRRALIKYLKGLEPRRVHVSTNGLGIHIRVDAVRPATYSPSWQDDELCIEVDLAFWTPDGRLEQAPWRLEHRKSIVDALTKRNWADVYSPGLPQAHPTDTADDDEYPPMAPDPHVPAPVASAIAALYCLEHEQWDVPLGASD